MKSTDIIVAIILVAGFSVAGLGIAYDLAYNQCVTAVGNYRKAFPCPNPPGPPCPVVDLWHYSFPLDHCWASVSRNGEAITIVQMY